MLLFSMKKNIYIYISVRDSDKVSFLWILFWKKVANHLYQNLWSELGLLSKQIHSYSQVKGHMLHLKNVSPNSNCYPAVKELMYFIRVWDFSKCQSHTELRLHFRSHLDKYITGNFRQVKYLEKVRIKNGQWSSGDVKFKINSFFLGLRKNEVVFT